MIGKPFMIVSSFLLIAFDLLSFLPMIKATAPEGKNFLQFPLIPYHENERRKLAASTTDDVIQMDALYQGYGTHYVDLWVGTPPQRQTLIVGTDSHIAGFPCSGCKDCGGGLDGTIFNKFHTDKSFDERESNSFQKIGCTECETGTSCPRNTDYCSMSVSYAEGSSWFAYEARDMVYAGGPHNQSLLHDDSGDSDIDPFHAVKFSFFFLFGCQTRVTGLFKTQMADGILGMNQHKASLWSQMHDEGIINGKSFSLCFTRQNIASSKGGTEAGAMTLGGYDERLHETNIMYTPLGNFSGAFRQDNFHTRIRKIYLRDGAGGETAKAKENDAKLIQLDIEERALNLHPIIIGSGTTDTYLPLPVGELLHEAFQELSGKPFSHDSMRMTESEVRALPTILLQLNGDIAFNQQIYSDNNETLPATSAVFLDAENPYDVILAIPPTHYMSKEKGINSEVYTNRLYIDDYASPVIGANGMMGHDIFFDIEGQRIGWAESNCNYHELLKENGFDENVDTNKKKKESNNNNNNNNNNSDQKEKKKESAQTTISNDEGKDRNIPNKHKSEQRKYVPEKGTTSSSTKNSSSIKNIIMGAFFGSFVVVVLGLFGLRMLRKNKTIYRAVMMGNTNDDGHGPIIMESEMRDLSLVEEDHFPIRRQYEIGDGSSQLPAVS